MELFEYIKSQLPQMPNTVIMKQLGASQELIDYVKETPENTNFTIAEVIEGSGGGNIGEVWFVGDTYQDLEGIRDFILSNVDDVDYKAELYDNYDNYVVYLNGNELPLVSTEDTSILWADSDNLSTMTMAVGISLTSSSSSGRTFDGRADYTDISTAPTSVEVSVKAK